MRRWVAFGLLWVGFCILGPGQAASGTMRVTLPVGTKAKEVGPGHYRFLLPDGKSLEVRNFNPGTGVIGTCGLFTPSGRKLSGGKNGKLVGRPAVQGIPGKGAAQIDDEVTWLRAGGSAFRLPAVVEISDPDPPPLRTPPNAVIDPGSPMLPKAKGSAAPGARGLSPQSAPGRR